MYARNDRGGAMVSINGCIVDHQSPLESAFEFSTEVAVWRRCAGSHPSCRGSMICQFAVFKLLVVKSMQFMCCVI